MPLNQVQPSALSNVSLSTAAGNVITQPAGLLGDSWVSELHGKWYTASKSGNVWHASVSAVTIPVNASGLVSVFSLYNPAGSGKALELISFDLGIVATAWVINAINLVAELNAAAPTLTTAIAPVNGYLGAGNATAAAKVYSALTHTSGVTPTRVVTLTTFSATTGILSDAPIHYDFDGKILVAPGSIVSIATSTAANTASAAALGLSWAEWPI